jgi:uncharacterized protein (DUF849 family)
MTLHKVSLSCAVAGSTRTPSLSQHLPVTPAEIAESALGAALGRQRATGDTRLQH